MPDKRKALADPDSEEQRDISRAVNEAVLIEVNDIAQHACHPENDDVRGSQILAAARSGDAHDLKSEDWR